MQCSSSPFITGDTTSPVFIYCPSDQVINLASGQTTATTTWTFPTATDNSGVVTVTATSGHTSGDAFGEGTTTVVYTATDSSGLEETCAFNIILVGDGNTYQVLFRSLYTQSLANSNTQG